MNNNKKKKHFYFNFIFFSIYSYKIDNKKISFFWNKDNKDFIEKLQDVCEKNSINLALITKKNLNHFFGNINNIPIREVISILFKNFDIKETNNFFLIEDEEEENKIFYLLVHLTENQKENIGKFFLKFSEINNCKINYNSDDGTVIFTGFKKNEKIIHNYIDHINKTYNSQIILECKIILINKKIINSKNLDGIKFLNNLLSTPINSFNFLKSMLNHSYDNINDIVKFLSLNYNIHICHDIKVLVTNRKKSIFYKEESRYINNYYDLYLIEKKKIWEKNLKSIKAGILFEIIPEIFLNNILLYINYKESSFSENSKIPHILEIGFNSWINIPYNEVIVINGLNYTIKVENKKNLKKNFFLNFLFGLEEEKEIECQLVLFIKVSKK